MIAVDSPKYNRTLHLPWSPGGTSDDKRLGSVEHLLNKPLVLTEKMDGSNVCLEARACYARSHGGAPSHPSFDAFKAFHASVKSRVGSKTQIFGEWLYARHSIGYTKLPGHFLVFGVRDFGSMAWATWDYVAVVAEEIGTPTVPVLATVTVRSAKELENLTTKLAGAAGVCGGDREGVVVRVAGTFSDQKFELSMAKWVRADHVQTDDHWKSQKIVKNIVSR